MAGYDHREIDAKWQALWRDEDLFATPEDRTKPKFYILDMFPYPSGAGLHVGHPKGYVATDVVARAKRMMGFNVLHVMGWDSFGLPTERQAVREGRSPAEITARNVGRFKEQLENLGLSYDWSRELATSDEAYYRWTQWIFLKLYEKGLAYQAEVAVNWCPALGTVLANEEVQDGKYVETGDPVERRSMKQWMLRITAYADRLLDGLEDLDWPEGIKEMQRHWIGRSRGAEIDFAVENHEGDHDGDAIRVFTTRPDTLFGCTYVVLAPEHELVAKITTEAQREAVNAYCDEVAGRSERDRTTEAADADKTGVFTGAYARNPANGAKVPIWIADYVLASYGTGAVFACPAHDERDHAFAKKFELPIIEVVEGGSVDEAAYTGDGAHLRSEFLDGLDIAAAKQRIIAFLEEKGCGEGVVRYRLRDWLFSRQRYWGEPFPIIELEDGTVKPLPESELPVKLPPLDEYKPTEDGRPPLARAEDWVQTKDPETGAPAQRETNTMPQWAGSCWYYLRFITPKLDTAAWDPGEERYWMPVDLYVGGAEHATLHLLYSRFWHHVLYDLGLVSTPEPFQRLFNQGMIHRTSYRDAAGKYYYEEEVDKRGDSYVAKADGTEVFPKLEKMSKSKYNVVNPDDMCAEYGADALRLYELFMGPLEDGCEWETAGVAGTRRFLDRLYRLVVDTDSDSGTESDKLASKLVDEDTDDRELERALHAAIKKVSEAIESLRFNTAVSEMMMFVNEATKAERVPKAWMETFVRVLAPFAPHLGEELWRRLGHEDSLVYAPWPAYEEAKLVADTITLAVQVNGKLRSTLEVPADIGKDDAIAQAKSDDKVAKFLEGKTLRREIYVPGRLVNLVAN
ncbi:leucine--tRNA ligase [Haliangium ochraceum]|uniref:Leucine--tRNA ligase n=1 Tax=Haliangium ochraceum (strain DSM 14365 / JCM 11303 / SMP-2) TaxID=502025 RepID=D0LQB8_HALO1|nr:leucine--tRNA ligase [Haliangium ochraceum]ACY18927.1 leucyl-tRNA synthetase [Haliangium ochraceum DSM 14365]